MAAGARRVLSACALVLLIGGRPVAWRAGSVGFLLACAISICISRTFDATEVIPDGSMIQGDRPVVKADPLTGHARPPPLGMDARAVQRREAA